MKKYFIKNNVCTPYKLILNKVSGFLTANGWSPVTSQEEADIVIVGTCAAFHSLENESVDFIKDAKQHNKELHVFGCLPKISPEKVAEHNPDNIISSARWERFEELIDKPKVAFDDIEISTEFRLKEEYRLYDPGKQFVLVQHGCSSDCPYCPHKMGIGELKSRPVEEILKQVQSLVKKNVHTIVLTGNDIGSYGTDINAITFPDLLKKVLEISPKIHLSQLNANWVYKYRSELYPLLMNEKVKDFQVLIQTTSSRLLKLMEREPVVKKLRPFLKKVRRARCDIVFRTDIMIGYPTATEKEEQETLEYVAELFDEVAVHGFERFSHARIEKMGLPFYPQEVIDLRVQKALDYFKNFQKFLVHRGGQVYQTLVDIEKPKEQLRGIKDE